MRLTGIRIVTILLILGECGGKTSGSERTNKTQRGVTNTAAESVRAYDVLEEKTETDGAEEAEEKEQREDEDLPILPPIILLDFGNGTEEQNGTSDEKSKRTVNNGLGYGFERNSLHSRKYNYYFPAGKTGTTVSIEESISPFLPKTIIEKVQPNGQRVETKTYGGSAQQNLYGSASRGNRVQIHPSFQYTSTESPAKAQPIFGLRTKLYKSPTGTGFEGFQTYPSTPKPSISPYGAQNQVYRGGVASTTTPSPQGYTESSRYVTVNRPSYTTFRGNSVNYVTPSPLSGQQQAADGQFYTQQRQKVQPSYGSQGQIKTESSTTSPLVYNSHPSTGNSQPANGPSYGVENGVRYENKIFWKYPDGRVSDVPPATYVETTFPEFPALDAELSKSPSSGSIYESGPEDGDVYSQRPMQFPIDPEQLVQRPRPFISSDSLSSSLPQQQVYRLGYQNLVTQKQSANLAQRAKTANNAGSSSSNSFSSSPGSSPSFIGASAFSSDSKRKPDSKGPKFDYESYLQSTYGKYMVNSPNPEYTSAYTTESTLKSTTPTTNLFTASGGSSKKKRPSNKEANNFSNLQYSDILNYNPSISQYVRNPASILNVQPTFVQAGSSLIPVIILRVDGSPPTEPKVTPNINLKALLQQYLLQYANSLQELARPSSYDLGIEATAQDSGDNPGLEMIPLTREDARPSYTSSSYAGRAPYDSDNLEFKKDPNKPKYGERTSVRQKVKSVQIIDDPRFTTYKVKDQ